MKERGLIIFQRRTIPFLLTKRPAKPASVCDRRCACDTRCGRRDIRGHLPQFGVTICVFKLGGKTKPVC